MSRTTLVVSNDYPPRFGGIESFVVAATRALDDDVVVLTSDHPDAAEHDPGAPHPVHRLPVGTLLPTPAATAAAVRLLRETGGRRVLFGSSVPLGLMAPALRRAGAAHLVALSHGHEVSWSRLPVGRQLLRRTAAGLDHLGYISAFTRAPIAAAVGPRAAGRMLRLPPPVDGDRFHPGEPQPGRPPTVLAACRMVPRKGVDVLLRAWRMVLSDWPLPSAPELLLAGDGPRRAGWQRWSARHLADAPPRWLGAVDHDDLPDLMRRADLLALPVRTRLVGLSPEGLGLVFLEAAASGLPVLLGRSGGAPETVRDGVSGHVLDPRDPEPWAAALRRLLLDPEARATMGAQARAHALSRFGAARGRRVLRSALALDR